VPVLVRHTAMTAFRRRQQLAGQPGQDRPVTAAVSRAAAIRDDALAAMSRLGAQLSAALDQLAVLGGQLVLDGAQDSDGGSLRRHWGCRWGVAAEPAGGGFVGGGTWPMTMQ